MGVVGVLQNAPCRHCLMFVYGRDKETDDAIWQTARTARASRLECEISAELEALVMESDQ